MVVSCLPVGDSDVNLLSLQLHNELINNVEQLKARRLGQIEMDVCPSAPGEVPASYTKMNVCELMSSNKNYNAYVYFHPMYSTPPSQNSLEVNESAMTPHDPIKVFRDNIERCAVFGHDVIVSGGRPKRVREGTSTNDPNPLYFRCQCAKLYTGKKVNLSSGKVIPRDDYRTATITNDAKNNRAGSKGRHGSHRTDSVRCFTKEEPKCGFQLSIFHNKFGFYIKTKNGNPYHEHHASRLHLRMPSRLVGSKEVTIIQDLNSAKALSGVAANTHFVRTKRRGTPTLLSNAQIKYIGSKYKKKKKKGPSTDVVGEETSSLDDLLEHLEETDSSYITLLQRVKKVVTDTSCTINEATREGLVDKEIGSSSNEATALGPFDADGSCTRNNPIIISQLVNETCIDNKVTEDIYQVDTSAENDALIVADGARRKQKIDDEQDMVVSLAYVTPFELRQFKLFHLVLHIDATADTNNEGRPLLTVTAKDSNGKMFTVLRAFLANEQAWSFKWLFQSVFPVLLGQRYLNDVKIVLGDGDPQQISQLEDAIDKHFTNVYRTRCSWHIIDRGWTKKVDLKLGGKSSRKRAPYMKGKPRKKSAPLTEINKVARKVYRWLFSWAQAGHCETLEEFVVSKALLVSFVESKEVTALLGSTLVESILDFIRQHVEHHEDRFCYYKRHSIFHLETHSNTSHEGTNNGLFNCAAPVMPTNSMEKAAKTLAFNADLKTQNTMIKMQDKFASKKLWSSSPTSDYVTDLAESLILTEWRKADNYDSYRYGATNWYVCHVNNRSAPKPLDDGSDDDWEQGSDVDDNKWQKEYQHDKGTGLDVAEQRLRKFGVIPKFKRVYQVSVNKQHSLQCTCRKHERMGLPCRHIGSVIKKNDVMNSMYNDGFPLTSVKVFWRIEYYLFGMSVSPMHSDIRKTLFTLSRNDTTGVACPDLQPLPSFDVPDFVVQLFHSPAECRVLNYNDVLSTSSLRNLQDKFNRERFGDLGTVPVGLSQLSQLADDSCGGDDTFGFAMATDDNDDANPDNTSSSVLSSMFYQMAESINNSNSKERYENEAVAFFNDMIAKAGGDCDANKKRRGKRISMFPANSRRKKTHGTKHMKKGYKYL